MNIENRDPRPGWAVAAERVVEAIVHICGLSAIAFIVLIFAFIAKEGLGFLLMNGLDMFTSFRWGPTEEPVPEFGLVALLVGTAWVVGLSLCISVPVGVGAAVWMAEFASPRTREVAKIVVEVLAAIPSVVWGFVGVMIVNPFLQSLGAQVGLNGMNGAILLALMTLPLLVSLGEDALRAVPDAYRQAALAMGATKWEMVRFVLIPAARRGLLVATLLGIGRCVGETMAVLMATGHSVRIPMHPFDPVRTITATIAAELGEAVRGGDHYQVLFALGLVLFGITFVVNLVADLTLRGERSGAA